MHTKRVFLRLGACPSPALAIVVSYTLTFMLLGCAHVLQRAVGLWQESRLPPAVLLLLGHRRLGCHSLASKAFNRGGSPCSPRGLQQGLRDCLQQRGKIFHLGAQLSANLSSIPLLPHPNSRAGPSRVAATSPGAVTKALKTKNVEQLP